MEKKNKIRLNRYLALCGLGSRRKCDELIASGAIRVNNQVITEMGVRIDPDNDIVEYYNQRVEPVEQHLYILLNKPLHTVTTASDEKKRKNVLDVVNIPERIFPVGRLDFDTTGALLLTTDGKLAYLLSHPRFGVTKIYRVLLDRRIRTIDLYHLQHGIMLEGRKTAPSKAEEIRIVDNTSLLEIELHEGRNRQIRRMFDTLNYQVKKLHRAEFAGLRVDNLKPGEWRELSEDEIRSLKNLAEKHRKDVIENPHEEQQEKD
ncbi:MAG: rRNA pseudouridine synthase [Calditrichaeota bacterium]|nr:rRNA pseudouridine synthase [Calditrichota bacterium]